MKAAAAHVDVLIPERGRPDLLADTLSALAAARARIDVAHRVQVLVNGSAPADYAALVRAHTDIEWRFEPRALGFHGAIERLVAGSDAPWVYLLNSDMRLHADALRVLLPWRAADVYAIASQIEFADTTRRREETGWTVPVTGPDGQLELHDLLPPDACVRGHVYAGGGASLFQRAPLQRHLARSAAYAPFYFEDADWSLQAWADGLAVLHCPESRVLHAHRGTIGRYIDARTVERIVRRNLEHLRWRYGDLFGAPRWHGGRGDRLRALWRGLQREHREARRRVLASPAAPCLHGLVHKRYPHAPRFRDGRPRVLLVSPFAVLPPAHGGARRIVELARASQDEIDWILLHDEAPATPQAADADDGCFREIHPVSGRPDSADGTVVRWNAHAHPRMRAELRRLIAVARPDVICFEHVECIGLIESLNTDVPCLWTLHDAGRVLDAPAQARVQAALPRVHSLLLTTVEDLGYWMHPRQCLVQNGVRLPAAPPAPPGGDPVLLLVAPLRYAPNRSGLHVLLSQAWPELRTHWPALRLRVLGGSEARRHWGAAPLPAGVELVDGHVDPAPHYAAATLALNPQGEIEGSALKIAEALAHGRVMISTASGARGYEDLASPALLRVPEVAAMAAAIDGLLRNRACLAAASASARADIAPWAWDERAQNLRAAIAAAVRR